MVDVRGGGVRAGGGRAFAIRGGGDDDVVRERNRRVGVARDGGSRDARETVGTVPRRRRTRVCGARGTTRRERGRTFGRTRIAPRRRLAGFRAAAEAAREASADPTRGATRGVTLAEKVQDPPSAAARGPPAPPRPTYLCTATFSPRGEGRRRRFRVRWIGTGWVSRPRRPTTGTARRRWTTRASRPVEARGFRSIRRTRRRWRTPRTRRWRRFWRVRRLTTTRGNRMVAC